MSDYDFNEMIVKADTDKHGKVVLDEFYTIIIIWDIYHYLFNVYEKLLEVIVMIKKSNDLLKILLKII